MVGVSTNMRMRRKLFLIPIFTILVGIGLNLLVISVNHGHMPVPVLNPDHQVDRWVGISENTNLSFLGDTFLNFSIGRTTVNYSIGDILMYLGVLVFVGMLLKMVFGEKYTGIRG